VAPTEVQGMTKEEILGAFYATERYTNGKQGWHAAFDPARFRNAKLTHDLVDAKSGKVVVEAGEKMSPRIARKLAEDGLKEILVSKDEFIARYLAVDIINEETGEVLAEAGDEITEAMVATIEEAGVTELPVLAIDHVRSGLISATPSRSTRMSAARKR